MKKIFGTLTLAIIVNLLIAQTSVNFPAITSRSSGDKPIELKQVHISVFVVENIATTTFEMHFYNDNDRVMEGEFNFPLGNGVTVSRFALDVNGEMREGVVVDKEKATQAFEAISRRNVDPGLVEVTKGNNFKARVYPIPAKGYKKAILAFEQELTGDSKNYIYQLPLNIKNKLDNLSVIAEVVMNKPTVPQKNNKNINLEFTEVRNSYISEYKKENVKLEKHITFSIPKPDNISETLTYKGKVTSDNYFYINILPKAETRNKPKPQNITILWDESASGKDRDIEKELATIENYINWVGNGSITLKTFSNTIHATQNFTIVNGKCDKLIAHLKSTTFDGGTNLHAIDFSTIKSDEILLFTDGISNFGVETTHKFKSPIIAFNSSNIANHNILEHFASASNGLYINMLSLTGEEILNQLTFQQKRFIKADYDHNNITEFYPNSGQTITSSFSCAGIAEGAKNNVTLHFGFGNEITESKTVTVDNTKRIDNNAGERIWAQKKLKHLLIKNNFDEIKEHGKKFSLVTPGTSLIVLDDINDYVRYKITPPQSLLAEYNRIILEQAKSGDKSRKERLEDVCNMLKNDIAWWENVVDYRKIIEEKERAKKDENDISTNQSSTSNATPPPPPITEELMIVEDDVDLEETVVLYDIVEEEDEADEAVFMIVEDRESAQYKREMLNSEKSSIQEKSYSSTIKVKTWDSSAPYMSDLKATDANNLYKTYLTLKPANIENPSFYFDVATYMFQKDRREDGLRVISNLAELELENAEIMRTLGRKLAEYKFYSEAIAIFHEVLKSRSFEPHSYIDLGTTYADMGEYQKGIDNLYTVIEKNWDRDIISRFPGIELVVLHDINRIIHLHENAIDVSNIKSCFIKNMPLDMRIVIDWDANDTDIDLWVTNPEGERCSYSNKETRIGGKISNDITQGYGPEEYRLKYAPEGKYKIDVNFFGSSKQTTLSNVTVRATIYTEFSSGNEHKQVLTLQLEPKKTGDFSIGEIEFKK